ncbi:hypothetical protein GCM10020000_87380 [Streptomyces olivoverticillatus]
MARSELDREIEELVEILAVGLGRFVSGRELDGVRRTNATFFSSGGTRVLDGVEDRVGRWSYLPGWQRSGIRQLGVGAAAGGGLGYWADPEQTVNALQYGGVAAGGLVVAGGVLHAVRNRGQAELMREWVEPLHLALMDPLGIAPGTRPRDYLHIPKNFSDDEAEIRIDLPVNLQFNEQKVAEMVVKKLALQGVSFSWKYEGKEPYVLVKKVHRPPSKVVFSDPKVKELVKKRSPNPPRLSAWSAGRKSCRWTWMPSRRMFWCRPEPVAVSPSFFAPLPPSSSTMEPVPTSSTSSGCPISGRVA